MNKFEITIIIDNVSVPLAGEFEDSEWAVLLNFVDYTLELDKIQMISLGSKVKLTVSQSEDKPPVFTTELPSDDQLFALMHRIRPFILQREETYFNTVANIMNRRISHDQFREMIKRLKATFQAIKYQSMFQIKVNDGFLINSEEALQIWLNAFEYHRFQEKREIMEEVFKSFPENASRALFIMMLIEKVRAIRSLAAIVMVITKKQPQFTITV